MILSKNGDAPQFGRMSEDLPSSARERLASVAREVRFANGQRIVSCFESPRTLYIIQEGLAKMVGISEDGRERILHLFHPGELAGWVALEKEADAGCDVIAVSPVQALAIDRRDLLAVGRGEPSVLLAVAREVSRLFSTMADWMLALVSAEVPQRLSRLLLELADDRTGPRAGFVPLAHPLTHEQMAQAVGASRPHVSSVLRDLEEAGAVLRGRGRDLRVAPVRLAELLGLSTVEKRPALAAA
jgi:CRP/FNR family transcriptional regulator